MNKIPKWNLSEFFKGIDDPRIEQSIADTKKAAQDFNHQYHGKVSEKIKEGKLLNLLTQYENILAMAHKPASYAELVFSVSSSDTNVGAFLQKTRTFITEVYSQLLFFELELAHLEDAILKKILLDVELEEYRHFFKKLQTRKPHILSESEERIMEFKNLTSKDAFVRLFEQELAKQKFPFEFEGKKEELNQSQILNILYASANQKKRKAAAKVFTEGLLEKEGVLTFIMNTLAEDKKNEDLLRGFTFAEQSRHLANETKPEAVETMVQAVEESYDLVQEYYLFKKQLLGLNEIYDYDRYAPLNLRDPKKWTFEDAQAAVLDAFSNFHPDFALCAEDFFSGKRIDAALVEGKQGGAYCKGTIPELHAYVFMNFSGSTNDVMTLAHELGHGINFELMRKQKVLNYNFALTIAETASIFAETMVFKKLIETEKDPEILLSLYMQKIESIFASVHRQVSMYRFEQDFHRAYREGGELSRQQINELWSARQKQMFGNSVILESDYENWWMYISHFMHTPFYVYAYAFGELLTFGLMAQEEKDSKGFYAKYKEFLEAGGSKSPQELINQFEINLDDPQFWKSGLAMISKYLKRAKELRAEILKK